jgi:hypothetical protein
LIESKLWRGGCTEAAEQGMKGIVVSRWQESRVWGWGANEDGLKRRKRNQEDVKGENMIEYAQPKRGYCFTSLREPVRRRGGVSGTKCWKEKGTEDLSEGEGCQDKVKRNLKKYQKKRNKVWATQK